MIHDRFSKNYAILRDSAKNLPSEPGVYIWRDTENRIIYVGKARNLKNRLGSYFSGSKDVKTAALISHSKSIETIIVSNEYEALLLENTLIKQHSPKYNSNLKDGKTYPVIRISSGSFPRIFRTRHIVEDGSLYFGPFANVQAVDKTLSLIEKLFPLRKCRTLKKRESPCMYYHIDRCLAPCCGKVEEQAYKAQVERVRKLLAGETSALIEDLNVQMQEAAGNLKFEEAAGFRNAIRAIENLSESNSVTDMEKEDRDYIAWAAEGIFTTFSILSMRNGRMTGQELFSSRSAADEEESLGSFIVAYYSPDHFPPPQIFLMNPSPLKDAESPAMPDSFATLNRFFSGQFGFVPQLILPGEKRHIAALAMAGQNAKEELRKRLKERGAGPALDELKRVLDLKARPERIEGFDVAHLEGRHPVASLISFKNGVPDRKNYRIFKLRTVVGIVDDFAAMREAVRRRYSRLSKEGLELPDLVLIDGGIGQVNAAKAMLDELGITIDVAGLAKRDEEIWLPHEKHPIKLSKRSEALKILQFVRDETHRFATGFNQRLRSKDLYFPVLESIEGIGPKRAAAIMKIYKNLPAIAVAEPEEMAESCAITPSAARAVRAAVRLALEEQNTKNEESFAAENQPEYNK
jgi:excinuclease ABC subunit C